MKTLINNFLYFLLPFIQAYSFKNYYDMFIQNSFNLPSITYQFFLASIFIIAAFREKMKIIIDNENKFLGLLFGKIIIFILLNIILKIIHAY